MRDMLFHAHSGMRYLVLLAGIVSALFLTVQLVRGRPFGRGGRIAGAAFTGLLDLQALLGLFLLFVFPIYPALWGHIAVMFAAVAVAHVASVMNKKRPAEGRSHGLALAGVVVPLLLIVLGIRAIGRGLF